VNQVMGPRLMASTLQRSKLGSSYSPHSKKSLLEFVPKNRHQLIPVGG